MGTKPSKNMRTKPSSNMRTKPSKNMRTKPSSNMRTRGFTLIEVTIASAISSLLLLVIYMAFNISQNLFFRGSETVMEQQNVKLIFQRLSDDIKYMSRIKTITEDRTTMSFEIFNEKTISIDSDNNKLIQGKEVSYSTKDKKSDLTEYKVILRKYDEYEWTEYFGNSQTVISNILEPDKDGYPPDMLDSITGKRITKQGEYSEIIEQEEGREFLLQKVEFILKDALENVLTGTQWLDIKGVRTITINIEYSIKRIYGEQQEKTETKQNSATVDLVNMAIINKSFTE